MASAATSPVTLPPRIKWLLNLVLIFHLAAIFIPPFTFATRTGYEISPLAEVGFSIVQPYANAMFLNHGYAFFAPNAGPSHLVEYEVEFKNGEKTTQRFPDLESQWPRLFYHRHLMLAEWLHSTFPPATTPAWVPAEEKELRQEIYDRVESSFREHLRHQYDAQQVTLWRLEHQLIAPEEYLQGQRDLHAPQLYRVLPRKPVQENLP